MSGRKAPDLYLPTTCSVRSSESGQPRQVEGVDVLAIREEWLVEDRWWTERSIRRHYFELVIEGGRNLVVFRAWPENRWFSQRA